MECQSSGNCPYLFTCAAQDPHHDAPVELALGRAVPVDGAPYEIPVRTEEPSGCGMTVDPCAVRKEVAFVLIHFCGERCPCRNGAAFESERGDLSFDDDVIAKIHAARSTLPALECHEYRYFPSSPSASRLRTWYRTIGSISLYSLGAVRIITFVMLAFTIILEHKKHGQIWVSCSVSTS
jgi:hypothetical protein